MCQVHKHTTKYMVKYYEKFQGRLTLNLVFKHTGVTMKPHLPNSLLFLNTFVDAAGNNKLCYSWVLGVCPFGD